MSIEYEGTDESDNEVYALIEQGQKVGSLKVCQIHSEMLTIMHNFLREDLREHSRGTRLIRYVEDLGRQKGCKHIYVNAIAPEAKGFFGKLGYDTSSDEGGEYKGEKKLNMNDKVQGDID